MATVIASRTVNVETCKTVIVCKERMRDLILTTNREETELKEWTPIQQLRTMVKFDDGTFELQPFTSTEVL